MGMPISLALRGRHAHDDRGEAAWQAALEILHEADRMFSTYRERLGGLPAGPRRALVEECPAGGASGPRAGRARP